MKHAWKDGYMGRYGKDLPSWTRGPLHQRGHPISIERFALGEVGDVEGDDLLLSNIPDRKVEPNAADNCI